MATYYVDSTAGGAGTGADWANAFLTLTAAFTAGAAGDTYFVAENHAESTAGAVSLTPKGTSAAPDRVICVDSAGTVPPVSADLRTTATVTTTGANDLTLTASASTGVCYWYGINMYTAQSFRTGSGTHFMYECSWNLTGSGGSMVPGSANIFAYNHDFGFSNAGQVLFVNDGYIRIYGGTLIGSAVPTTLFSYLSEADFQFNGFNFAAKTTGTLVGMAAAVPSTLVLNNCKFGGAMTYTTPTHTVGLIDVNNSASTDTNYEGSRYAYQGTQTIETVVVQTGGASDGTTTISWKVVSNANNEYVAPFACKPIISEFNDTVGGAMTATVEILHDSVTALKDNEIWAEVEYLGTSGFPLSLFANDGVDVLSASAGQASSAVTWTTTGITNPNKQKLVVTFTPQEKGVAIVKVFFAKASYTVYVDPKVTIA